MDAQRETEMQQEVFGLKTGTVIFLGEHFAEMLLEVDTGIYQLFTDGRPLEKHLRTTRGRHKTHQIVKNPELAKKFLIITKIEIPNVTGRVLLSDITLAKIFLQEYTGPGKYDISRYIAWAKIGTHEVTEDQADLDGINHLNPEKILRKMDLIPEVVFREV